KIGAGGRVEKLQVVARRTEAPGPLTYTLSCSISGKGRSGEFSTSGWLDPDVPAVDAKLRAHAIDLSILSPFLAASGAADRASGLLEGELEVRYRPGVEAAAAGDLRVEGLKLEGGRLSAPVEDKSIVIRPNLAWSPRSGIRFDDLSMKGTAFAIEGKGSLDTQQAGDARVSFRFDLDRAQETFRGLLPARVRLAGAVNGSAVLRSASGKADCEIRVSTDGARVAPEAEPLSGSLDAKTTLALDGSSVAVREGTLDFGTLASGRFDGSWTRGDAPTLAGTADVRSALDHLSAWLSPWLPSGLELGGDLTAHAELTSAGPRTTGPMSVSIRGLRVGGRLAAKALERLATSPIRLDDVEIGASLDLDRSEHTVAFRDLSARVEPGVVSVAGTLSATTDRARAEFEGRIEADLAKVASAAGAFVPEGAKAGGKLSLDGKVLRDAGTYAADAKITATRAEASLASPKVHAWADGAISATARSESGALMFETDGELAAVDLAGARASGEPFELHEKGVAISASGRFAPWEKELDVRRYALRAPTAGIEEAVGSAKLAFAVGARTIEIERLSADLAPLATRASAFLGKPFSASGHVGGRAQVLVHAEGVGFDADLTANELSVVREGAPRLDPEPELDLVAEGRWTQGSLDLQRLRVDTKSGRLRLDASGKLEPAERGFAGKLAGTAAADLAFLSSLVPGGLPGGTNVSGRLDAKFSATGDGAAPRVDLKADMTGVRVGAFEDDHVGLEVAARVDRDADALLVEQAALTSEGGAIRAKAERLAVRDLSSKRSLEGEVVADADGAVVGRLLAGSLPAGVSLDGPGSVHARLGGFVGDRPISTIRAEGDVSLPVVVQSSMRIEKARTSFVLEGGVLTTKDATGEIATSAGRGTVALNANARLDDPNLPFTAAGRLDALPAARELNVPLAHVFPLFAGDFRFASFSGTVGGETQLHGSAHDLRSTLTGNATVDITGVTLIPKEDFAQVLAVLELDAVAKEIQSITEHLEIRDGRIFLKDLAIDGDRSKLPLSGSIGLDGALDVALDLSAARLPKHLEPYRPVLAVFGPALRGSVAAPRFAIKPPTAQGLLQAATKIAAGSVLGGKPGLDIGALTRIGSLSELGRFAKESQLGGKESPSPPTPPEPRDGGQPAGPVNAAEPPKSSASGAMPADLSRAFRALARGEERFDYARLNADAGLAHDLERWLAEPPPKLASDDAHLADLLNRHEVALALSVAEQVRTPLFAVVHAKEGVHDVSGFFDRAKHDVAGESRSLDQLAAEIRKLGGGLAIYSIPRAARDGPPIAREGHQASTVRKEIETRAKRWVAERVKLGKGGKIAVPPILFQAAGRDEAAIRKLLRELLPEGHPVRPVLERQAITTTADDLRLDAP
ncbi:MAG TPA: DUF748 domain-containing protein, partial [Planctomycetota bacterium]|nr:DUF748 domain-containing protein [Planctomycetota bacterium]